MANLRNATVRLMRYKGTSNRVISWRSYEARDNYFDSKNPKKDMTASMSVKDISGVIRFNGGLSEVDGFNYGYFFQGDGIRRYFFIQEKVYVNEGRTDLVFTLDLITTGLPTATTSLVERREIPASSRDSVPEQVYNGALQANFVDAHYTNGDFRTLLATSGTRSVEGGTTTSLSTTYDIPKLNGLAGENTTVKMPIGIYDGGVMGFSEVSSWASDMIICSWAVPEEDVGSVLIVPAPNATLKGNYGTKTVNISASGSKIANDNYQIMISDMANPYNAITIPWNLITESQLQLKWVSDPVAGIRVYEITDGLIGTGENIYRLTINTKIDLPTVNDTASLASANVRTNQQASPLGTGLQNLGSDILNALADNKNLTGAVGNDFIDNPINWFRNNSSANGEFISQAQADLAVAGRQPLSANGFIATNGVGTDSVGINIWLLKTPTTVESQFNAVYRANGYSYCQIETPALRDGNKHLYAGDINLITDYMTAGEEAIMKQLYAGGVWQFASEDTMYNY